MGRTCRRRWQRRKLAQDLAALISPTESAILPNLFKYMAAQGWRNATNLTARRFMSTGRGLCSKSVRLQCGDELLRIPLKCLITIHKLENDAGFKALFNDKAFNNERRVTFQALLAWYLLYHIHLHQDSPLCAYLKTIPDNFNTPYFCTPAELHCLPDNLLECTVLQHRQISGSYAHFKAVCNIQNTCDCCGQALFDKIYSLSAYKWAYFAVNTRSVHLDTQQPAAADICFFNALLANQADMALAPFLDLCNHSDNVATTAELVQQGKNDAEYVITLKDLPAPIKPYTQIFISYGTHTNIKLLTEYGFILTDNAHNCFEITLNDIEQFINSDKALKQQRTFHSNKFKFIRDHQLDVQMFVHLEDDISHNLSVVLNLLFKVESHYANALSYVAFGGVAQLQDIREEANALLYYKVAEYQRYIAQLSNVPDISQSGLVALDYLLDCVRYLEEYLERM